MRKMVLFMLVTSFCSFAQNTKKVEHYSYGKNGIEYITKSDLGTTIVSTFNSRPEIKDEIAINVFNYYKAKSPKNGEKITILAKDAMVLGTCYITKNEKVTSIEFHYEKVEWKNGLTEIYSKKNTTTAATFIAESDD